MWAPLPLLRPRHFVTNIRSCNNRAMAITTATATNRIKFLRRARGWSQAEFARRAGLSRSTIEQTELGRTPRPSTQKVLADVFGLEPSDLFPEE
jgi:DNA-binding XRE family transcriptional regulator